MGGEDDFYFGFRLVEHMVNEKKDFGFWWPWWVYVWVSTAVVGLALEFNGGGRFGFGSPLLPFTSYFYGFV